MQRKSSECILKFMLVCRIQTKSLIQSVVYCYYYCSAMPGETVPLHTRYNSRKAPIYETMTCENGRAELYSGANNLTTEIKP